MAAAVVDAADATGRGLVLVEEGRRGAVQGVGEDLGLAVAGGLGVRVEDCVAVTDADPLVLTADAAKSIDDIEALRAERLELEPLESLR